MSMLRATTLVAVVSAVLLMTGCTSSEGDGAGPRGDDSADPATTGCGQCVEELADVRAELEALPEVSELLTLEIYGASPTNSAGVQVELRSTSTRGPRVVEEVARIVWQSGLAPVDEVFVTVEDASGELVRGASPFDFSDAGGRRATYAEQWGPRPVDG
jgi:hypothetical protein